MTETRTLLGKIATLRQRLDQAQKASVGGDFGGRDVARWIFAVAVCRASAQSRRRGRTRHCS